MQRFIVLIVLAAIVMCGTLLGRVDWRAGPAAAAAPATAPVASTTAGRAAAQDGAHFLGVSTCASAACHGGPADSPQERKWNAAYTIWAQQDPHAQAYSVLFSDRSKQMVKLLRRLDKVDDAQPQLEQRCLACHSVGAKHALPETSESAHTAAAGAARVPAPWLNDGVSCEACHGAASSWLVPHTTENWASRGPDKYREFGMINTRDLATRVQMCAKCHIGAPEDSATPLRDMNHDLIAAGHPRLNFEAATYMANMPHHWNAQRLRQQNSSYEAQLWALGQVTSAETTLKLLETRAAAAQKAQGAAAPAAKAAGAASKHGGPGLPIREGAWPEFSEYDCYACHHDLRAPSYRQVAREGRTLGTYAWGTWYMTMPRFLAEADQTDSAGLSQLDKLAREVARPWPNPQRVVQLSQSSAKELSPLLAAVNKPYSTAQIDRLLVRLIESYQQTKPTNWDQWTQCYLAIRALHAARADVSANRRETAQDKQISQALTTILEALKFPGDEKNARGRPTVRFESPRDFDPAKVAAAFDHLLQLMPHGEQ